MVQARGAHPGGVELLAESVGAVRRLNTVQNFEVGHVTVGSGIRSQELEASHFEAEIKLIF